MLTIERLHEVLHYDGETGVFTRRVATARRTKVGDLAGHRNAQGYWRVKIDSQTYQGHRLAWAYTHGVWPVDEIDHINGVRDDNRMSNLREATHAENLQNERKARPFNVSGCLGVTKRPQRTYQARIMLLGERYTIGSYSTAEEARIAYQAVKAVVHPFAGNSHV